MSRLARPLIAALAVLAVLFLGIWLGGHPAGLPNVVRDHLVDKHVRILDEALDTIDDTYYVEPGKTKLSDEAIKGMVAARHDRFSNYFTPAEYKAFNAQQKGDFVGIGVLVSSDPLGLKVEQVYKGSPADRAGVKADDIIINVAGHVLKGLSTDAASAFIKGPEGTPVKLTVKRGKAEHSYTATRATVTAPLVASKLIKKGKDKVGEVALAQFGPGAHAEVYQALKSLQARGATRFILDLRDNGGGLVTEAQLVASAFLKSGTIVTTKGRAVKTQTLSAIGDPVVPDAPLVVLVNQNTASASEIVTGALQDHKRATIVGTHTFGKGIFQEVIELSNGGALDITAGQYFLPSGRNIGGKGVTPGAGIQPDIKADDNPKTAKVDEALDKAVDVVADK